MNEDTLCVLRCVRGQTRIDLPAPVRRGMIELLRRWWLGEELMEDALANWEDAEGGEPPFTTSDGLNGDTLFHPFVAYTLDPEASHLDVVVVGPAGGEPEMFMVVASGGNPTGGAFAADGALLAHLNDGRLESPEDAPRATSPELLETLQTFLP